MAYTRVKQNDMYNVGNDYDQVPSAYFKLDSYQDGIYTELNPSGIKVVNLAGTEETVSGMKMLNKRIEVVNQSAFATFNADLSAVSAHLSGKTDTSAIFTNEFATGLFVNGQTSDWVKPDYNATNDEISQGNVG